MKNIEDEKREFMMHCLVGMILDAIRRNGIEKTLEDLHNNFRLSPASDEQTYQDLLKVINRMSERREIIAQKKKKRGVR